MPRKNKADRRKYQRAWVDRNRDTVNAYNRARYALNPEPQKAATLHWVRTHKARSNETRRLWMNKNRARLYNRNTPEGRARLARDNRNRRRLRRLLKIEVLTHYGKDKLRCRWPGCKIADIDMLTLDHVNNDGAEDRKHDVHVTGNKFYRTLKKRGFPKGFQTLCANHQLKKELIRKRKRTGD